MAHPNEYPGKIFVPWEGDMPVETVEMPVDADASREGIAGIGPERRDYETLRAMKSAEEMVALGPESKKDDFPEVDLEQLDSLGMWN